MKKLLKGLCITEIILAVIIAILSLFVKNIIALRVMLIVALVIIALDQVKTIRRNK